VCELREVKLSDYIAFLCSWHLRELQGNYLNKQEEQKLEPLFNTLTGSEMRDFRKLYPNAFSRLAIGALGSYRLRAGKTLSYGFFCRIL